MFFESLLINVSVILVLLGALIFDYVTKFFSYWYIRHVQYKTPVPFFGSDYHRVLGLKNTTDEISALYKEYPNEKFVGCIKSRIPDLIIKDPGTIKKVLSANFSNFHYRGCELDKSRDICLRNNLFYAEGEKWTFLRRKFELLLNHMSDDLQESLHNCLPGSNGDLKVQQILSRILDVVFRDLLLDNNIDVDIIKNTRETIEKRTLSGILKSYLKDIFPSIYVLFGFSDVSAADLNKLNDTLKSSKLIKNIQKVEITDNETKGDKKFKLNESEFFYSAFLLFVSEGYIPCHNVLVALLFELAKHPEIQKQVRVCDVNSNEDDALNRAIKETLRLHPPYSVISRKCTNSYQISEKEMLINKGITVTIPINNLHKDEEYFNKSEEFNPDRFLEDELKRPEAFLPFGLGPRKCIGERLALRIVRGVTYAILNKFQLETTERTPSSLPVVDFNFKRVIDGDVWLRFQPV